MDADYEPVADTVDVADILEDLQEIEGDDAERTDSNNLNIPDPSLAYLYAQHPETILEYVEEVIPKITPTADNPRKSMPFLTTFERTKVLGFRSTQLSQGARPFIKVPEHVSDIKEIARLELEARRLPFILRRPMPNGTFEYWRISDLMIL
jgi:DNA-directed RNA polymerase subunit K/omega